MLKVKIACVCTGPVLRIESHSYICIYKDMHYVLTLSFWCACDVL